MRNKIPHLQIYCVSMKFTFKTFAKLKIYFKYRTGYHDDTVNMQQQKGLKLLQEQDQVRFQKVIPQP